MLKHKRRGFGLGWSVGVGCGRCRTCRTCRARTLLHSGRGTLCNGARCRWLRPAPMLAVVQAGVVGVPADAARILSWAAANSGKIGVARFPAVGAPGGPEGGMRGGGRLALLGSITLLGAAAKTVEAVLRRREGSLKPAHVGFGKLELRRVRQRRSEQ